jgi:hypothetical protein
LLGVGETLTDAVGVGVALLSSSSTEPFQRYPPINAAAANKRTSNIVFLVVFIE